MESAQPAPQDYEREKPDRIKSVLAILRDAPVVNTSEEALQQVTEAFRRVEGPLLTDDGRVRDRMKVHELRHMTPLTWKGRTVYFQVRKKHVLFVADSGAYDIREHDGSLTKETVDLEDPRRGSTSLLEKPGSGVKSVWSEV